MVIKFYDKDNNLKKIISSKTENFPLLLLDFENLQKGGCGAFSLTTSIDLSLKKDYLMRIYVLDELQYTGYILKTPIKGTPRIYKYSGYGIYAQLSWQIVDETFSSEEIKTIIDYLLSTYIYDKTQIIEE